MKKIFKLTKHLLPINWVKKLSSRQKLYFWTGMVAFFLILIPAALYIYQQTNKVEAAWFNDSWGYRQTVNITNSGSNQTDYQVAITLDTATLITAGKMQSNCNDIRITDINGKILPYWISSCNNASTKIWPKIPSLPTSGASVYIYYGNPSAGPGKTKVGTQTYPGLSCKSILDAGDSSGTGSYWIDPDNGGTANASQAYCDMTNNSGGWMLVTSSMIDSVYTAYFTSTPSTDQYGGVGYNFVSTGTGCGNGQDPRATVLVSNNYQWDKVKSKKTLGPTGTASCWGVDGNGTVNSNLQSFNETYDTLQSCVLSCSTSPFVMPPMTRCDNAAENFARYNSSSSRSFEQISRRTNRTTVSGPATGLSCNTMGVNWRIDDIYIREDSLTYSSLTVASPTNEEKSPAPVAYWKFDEGYGTTANDASGRGKTGTFLSAPIWKTEDQCISGKCLSFDNVDDGVSIANENYTSLTDYTMCAWINPKGDHKHYTGTIMSSGDWNNVHWAFGVSQTNGVIQTRKADGINSPTWNYTLPLSQWTYVCITRSGATITAYANGKQVGNPYTGTTGNLISNATNTSIGRETYAGGYFAFNGLIDEPKIYSYARSADQIKSDFSSRGSVQGVSSQIGGNNQLSSALSNGLVAYWKGDEASGNSIDSSGNSNTGTVAGSNNYGSGKFGNGFRSGVATTNLITNPSLETNQTSWNYQYVSQGSATTTTDKAVFGSKSLAITRTVAGSEANVYNTLSGLSASTTYYFSAWAWANTSNTACMWTYNAGTNMSSVCHSGSGQWERIGGTFISTAGGGAQLRLAHNSSTLSTVYFDGVQVELGSTATPYLDGSLGTGYSWTGTAHASTSTRTASSATTATNVNNTTGTIAYWFNSPSLDTSAQCPFGASDGDNNGGTLFGLKNTGIYLFHNYGVGVAVSPQYVATINNNTWYHVAYSWDNTSRKGNLYVNGTLAQSVTFSEAITKGEYLQNLGTCTRTGYTAFNGTLDDVRAYNRALSPAEVSALYSWAPGPIGYWNFEEGQGATASDKSGSGNNGTIYGGSSWTSGKYGKALKFNGSNSYVGFTPPSGMNYPVTISAWARPRTLDQGGIIVSLVSGNVQAAFGPYNTGNKILVDKNPSGGHLGLNGISNYLTANKWQYWTVVHESATTMRFYLDGKEQTLVNVSDQFDANQSNIGARANGTQRLFDGDIDEVRIYNYARTPGQIVEDMNAGHPIGGSPIASQLGYWKFDEGYGGYANNSGNGGVALRGTITNATWNNEGKLGKALNYDGSGDYATVSNNPALNFGLNSFSVSYWLNFNPGSSQQRWTMGKGFPYQSGGAGWAIADWTTGNPIAPDLYVSDGIGAPTSHVAHFPNMNRGTWYQLTFVVDRTANLVKTYFNGVYYNQLDISSLGSFDNTSDLLIGTGNGTGNTSDVKIDELKIYNTALTADQIKLDYNQGKSLVLGSTSDTSGLTGGSVASNSASAEYCIPGDTSPCGSPVARWDFNEKQGVTANDSSGNGNSGTLGGGTASYQPTWTSGKVGSALKFDGSNDYISTNLDIYDLYSAGAFTVEAWSYDTATSSYDTILSSFKSVPFDGFFLRRDTGGVVMSACAYNAGSGNCVSAPAEQNIWLHWTVTYSGGVMKLYKNGSYQSQDATTTMTDPANKIIIGANYTNSENWSGKIDQVKIYNYARTPAQVAWDYNQGKPVGWWKLDECQGGNANDSSGNGNIGTITIGGTGTQTTAGTCTTPTDGTGAWYNGRTGKFNSSLKFDSVDDFVSIPNIGGIIDGSISMWFYFASNFNEDSSPRNALYSFYGGSESHATFGNYTGGYTGELLTINVAGNWGLWTGNQLFNKDYVPAGWHFFTLTRDTTGGSFYMDGHKITDGPVLTGGTNPLSISTTTSPFHNQNNTDNKIGAMRNTIDYFNGQIDDVRVYNYALTSSQVKNVMNQGAAVRYGPSQGSP